MTTIQCHPRRTAQARRPVRRGLVLVIVLILVVLMSFGAYTFTSVMVNERVAVDLSSRQVQARMQVDSGVDYLRLFLAQDRATREEAGGSYDNPGRFRMLLVRDDTDPSQRGRVTIVTNNQDSSGVVGGLRYGLSDESSKLNLNSLIMADEQIPGSGRQLLLTLPGMTQDIADAILDWIDADDTPREFGAEVDYYSSLEPPYAPRNGPLETVEELLLVRGVVPEMLFGLDQNRNGLVDQHEQGGELPPVAPAAPNGEAAAAAVAGASAADPTGAAAAAAQEAGSGSPAVSNATLELGWTPFLTLYSMERNTRPDGQPRIYLNNSDLTQLSAELSGVFPPEWVTYILGYRLYGPYVGNKQPTGPTEGQLDLTQQPKFTITQILDLIGPKVQVRFQGEQENVVLKSPFENNPIAMGVYLPLLMDNVTVNPASFIPGRININQAPQAILAGIPGLDQDMINEILSRRDFEPTEERPNRRYETWLAVEGIVSLEEMRLLMPFICGGGDVYRGQVVGYFEDGGPSARAEVVVDATTPLPRVLFWRDLTHLGRGFALETLGVEALAE